LTGTSAPSTRRRISCDVNDSILDGGKYREIFSVDAIRERVEQGVPFRDAYREVARLMKEGTLQERAGRSATHQGSTGNLCNDRIREMIIRESGHFDSSRRDAAFRSLLAR
jgi:argininosuccinate lyase